jgi:hypothetical protein
LTFVVAYWCIGFEFAWNSNKAYEKINNGMVVPVRNEKMAKEIRLLSPFSTSAELSHTSLFCSCCCIR